MSFQLLSHLIHDPSVSFHNSLKAAQTFSDAIYHDGSAEAQGDFWPFHDLASLAPFLVKKAQNSLEGVLQVINVCSVPYIITDDEVKNVRELLELTKISSISNEVLINILKLLRSWNQRFENEAKEMFLRLTQQPRLSIEQVVQLAQVYLSPYKNSLSEEEDNIAQLLLQYCQQLDIPNDQTLLAITTLYKLTPRSSEHYQQASQKLWYLVRSANLTLHQRLLALGALISSINTSFIEKLNIIKIAITSLSTDDIQNLIREHGRYTLSWGKPEISHIPLIAELLSNKALPGEARNSLYEVLAKSVPHFNLLSEK